MNPQSSAVAQADEAGQGRSRSRDYGGFFIASGLAALGNILCTWAISRGFGAEGVGIYALNKVVPMAAFTLFSLGVQVGALSCSRNVTEFRSVQSTFLWVAVTLTAFLSLLTWALSGVLRVTFFEKMDEVSFRYSVLLLPVSFFVNIYVNVFRINRSDSLYVQFSSARTVLSALFVVVAVLLVRQSALIPGALLAGEVAFLVPMVAVAARKYGLSPVRPRLGTALDMIKFGAKAQIGNVFAYLNVRFDQLLITTLLPLQNLGEYSLVVNISEGFLLVQRAIGNANLSHATWAKDGSYVQYIRRLFGRLQFWSTLILLVTLPLFYVFVPVLFGASFSRSWVIYAAILPGTIALGGATLLSTTLTGLGFPLLPSLVNLVAVVVTVGLDLLLIPKIGILGAAVGSSVGYAVQAALMFGAFRAKLLKAAPAVGVAGAGD